MQSHKQVSVTEKIFLLAVFILISALTFNIIGGKVSLLSPALAEEGSTSEDSADSEDNEDSVDEEGSVDEESTNEESTQSVDEENSTLSVENEESTVSVVSEVSIVSELSEVSTQETSVHSGANIEDFDNVENLGQNIAVVTVRQKLFFLIPVDIDQTVELDEEGNVLDVRQTILNMILDWLSF